MQKNFVLSRTMAAEIIFGNFQRGIKKKKINQILILHLENSKKKLVLIQNIYRYKIKFLLLNMMLDIVLKHVIYI